MNFLSLLVPIAYLGILVGSLATFSHLYRQRKLNAKLRLEPYFGTHITRNIYLTLLHQSDTQQDLKNVPNSLLCAALQERAIEDIMRIREIQTRKQPLKVLLERGVVGDEIWQRLLRAEQEMEVELKDVVAEANALANGWGQIIFQSANEIAQSRILKKKLSEVKESLSKEKDAWDAQREKSRRELEGETEPTQTTVEPTDPVTPAPSADKIKAAGSSDDDAVLVETPGSEGATAGSGKSKKKKNKKG